MLNTSISYYQLLDISPDATHDELEAAYQKKILELSHQKVTNTEIYQTAYYTLSDVNRRKSYDDSIGLLHKNKIPLLKRMVLILGRLFFTLLDTLSELIWSFIIVLIIALIGYGIHYYNTNDVFLIKDMLLSIDKVYFYVAALTIIFSLILYVLHPRIRRTNRNLKHSLRKYK